MRSRGPRVQATFVQLCSICSGLVDTGAEIVLAHVAPNVRSWVHVSCACMVLGQEGISFP
eukprot:289024-Rhodomonas_salina.1